MALLALYAAIERDFPACFAWLGVALFIDGVDGTLARVARVTEVASAIDGVVLDLVVDFLTYVLVPVVAIWRSDLMSPTRRVLARAARHLRLRALFRRHADEDRATIGSAAFPRSGTSSRSICSCCGRRASSRGADDSRVGRDVRADRLRASAAGARNCAMSRSRSAWFSSRCRRRRSCRTCDADAWVKVGFLAVAAYFFALPLLQAFALGGSMNSYRSFGKSRLARPRRNLL